MIVKPSRIIVHAPHLLPKARAAVAAPASNSPQRQGKIKIDMPQATWSELHLRALKHAGESDEKWLAWFGIRVGGNCDCRQHWNKQIKITPPDFKNYFGWTVAMHNAVNARLEKPLLTEEEAHTIWGKNAAIPYPILLAEDAPVVIEHPPRP